MKVLIATRNQGKIEGARRAFERYFEDVVIEGVSVSSGVGDQPVNEEICIGAKNRIKNLKQYCREHGMIADLYVAIESGIHDFFGDWVISNIAIIEDNENFVSIGSSASFPVPQQYVQKIIDTDFNEVMNAVFEKDDNRRNNGGGIQLLTHNEISRIDLTEQAFIMALTRYINAKWN